MKVISFAVIFGLLLGLGLGGSAGADRFFGVPSAFAEEETVYLADEIDFHFAQEQNMHHFTMLIGKLVDLARVQERIFKEKNAAAQNPISANVEESLNDANGFASQHDYRDAFGSLGKAYDLLKTSMQELGVKKSNVVPSESNWKILK